MVDATASRKALAIAASAMLASFAFLPQPSQAQAAPDRETGKRLFTNTVPACAICHTLRDADASGAIGPVLDELQPDAERVAKALRNGLGNMPSFSATLTSAEIEVLARYVAEASRKK